MINYSITTTPTSVYTIDNTNQQENCANIPGDAKELKIAYEGFKSTTGIGRAPNLERITIVECIQEIHFDEVVNCTNLKEIQLIRSQTANKYNLDKLNCRVFADLSNMDFDAQFIPLNVTALQLKNCELTKVPNLHKFVKLVEVRFGDEYEDNNNNKIDVVDVANLPKNIQILDLSDCNLTIQPDLRSFESLLSLCLQSNEQIHWIDTNRLPKQLQKLDTSYCGFVEQLDLYSMQQLKELNLEGNVQIQKIDPNMLPKQLLKLDICGCGLTEQPDFRAFESLVELNLFDNKQIMKIDPKMLPKQLQNLYLGECDLTELPDLHQLDSLVDLSLSGNEYIQKIVPNRLPTNIEVLYISKTGVSSLMQLCNFTKLKELDVRQCKIDDINQLQALKLMSELQIFRCCNNDICKNFIIKLALALVLPLNMKEVRISKSKLNLDIVDEIKQRQNDLNNIENPFTKTLDEMLDEQFYEDHKDEIIQLQIDSRAIRYDVKQFQRKIKQLVEMRHKVDEENNLIIRVLVEEE